MNADAQATTVTSAAAPASIGTRVAAGAVTDTCEATADDETSPDPDP